MKHWLKPAHRPGKEVTNANKYSSSTHPEHHFIAEMLPRCASLPQGKACVSICIPSCGRPLGAVLCLDHCKHLDVRAERGQAAKQLYKCCCLCQNTE